MFLVSPDELLSSGSVEVVRLCDPHTGGGAMYVLDKVKKTLHEIKEFDEGHRYIIYYYYIYL